MQSTVISYKFIGILNNQRYINASSNTVYAFIIDTDITGMTGD